MVIFVVAVFAAASVVGVVADLVCFVIVSTSYAVRFVLVYAGVNCIHGVAVVVVVVVGVVVTVMVLSFCLFCCWCLCCCCCCYLCCCYFLCCRRFCR